jgi:hypothetical protein
MDAESSMRKTVSKTDRKAYGSVSLARKLRTDEFRELLTPPRLAAEDGAGAVAEYAGGASSVTMAGAAGALDAVVDVGAGDEV